MPSCGFSSDASYANTATPPDKQAKATQTVLEQAEALSEGWTSV